MRLPVLMYHDITQEGKPDFLTVTLFQLEQQLKYIKEKGYHPISLHQLYNYLTKGESFLDKSVLLSFDDGFKSNFTYLYPLLVRFQMKAVIFLVADFIAVEENNKADKYLHLQDIMQMNGSFIDFGFHSFDHKNYRDLSIEEIDQDLQKMKSRFTQLEIGVVPVFAYPFGAFPKKDKEKNNRLKQLFHKHQITGAFRIGNRINPLPLKKRFAIERIDVRGTDSFWKFKIMLRIGRKWLM